MTQFLSKLVVALLVAAVVVVAVIALGRFAEYAPRRASAALVDIDAHDLVLHPAEGRFYYRGAPYTGRSYKRYANNQLAERTTFRHGRKHGLHEKWFEDGTRSFYSE